MKENMVQRGISLSPEGHAALFAKMEADNLDMAEILRDLLQRYVDGTLRLEASAGTKKTKFYSPPALMRAAEEKGETQGYSFGVLVGRLVDKALVQNHQGETHEN